MTTATRDKPNDERRLEDDLRVLRQIELRLRRLGPEDQTAVGELLRLIATASGEELYEARKAIVELMFPEVAYKGLIADIPDDPEARSRVDAYRLKVGREIRKRRHRLKMTQADLAKAAGIPQSHVSRLERCIHAPTHLTIERLAKALGTTPSQLDPGFDDPDVPESS